MLHHLLVRLEARDQQQRIEQDFLGYRPCHTDDGLPEPLQIRAFQLA